MWVQNCSFPDLMHTNKLLTYFTMLTYYNTIPNILLIPFRKVLFICHANITLDIAWYLKKRSGCQQYENLHSKTRPSHDLVVYANCHRNKKVQISCGSGSRNSNSTSSIDDNSIYNLMDAWAMYRQHRHHWEGSIPFILLDFSTCTLNYERQASTFVPSLKPAPFFCRMSFFQCNSIIQGIISNSCSLNTRKLIKYF